MNQISYFNDTVFFYIDSHYEGKGWVYLYLTKDEFNIGLCLLRCFILDWDYTMYCLMTAKTSV